MPRVQVQSPVGPQGIRPAASPVSRTARAQVNGLQQLAGALAEVEPALGRLTQVVRKQEAEQALAEGASQAQELIDQQKTYAQAVKEGLIRPDQNPWFRLGMKQQFGEVAANDYALQLQNLANDMIERGVTDPSVWDQAEAQFRTQWVKENVGNRDPAFDMSFADKANQLAYGIGTSFAARAGAAAMAQVEENAYAQAFGVMRRMNDGELTRAEAMEEIRNQMEIAVNEMGVSGSIYNPKVVAAITDAASTFENVDLLTLLDEDGLRGGTGPLGNTDYAVVGRDKAELEIARRAEAAAVQEERARTRRIREQQEQAVNLMVDEYRESGTISQDTANRLALEFQAQAPDIASYIRQLPATIGAEGLFSNPALTANMEAGIITGNIRLPDIVRAVGQGDISGTEGFSLMARLSQQEALKNQRSSGDSIDILRDVYYTERESSFRRFAGASDAILAGLENADEGRARVRRYSDAVRWVQEEIAQFQLDNPAASVFEQRNFINEVFEQAAQLWYPEGTDPAFAERQVMTDDQWSTVRRMLEAGEDPPARLRGLLRALGYDLTNPDDINRILDTSNN